MSASTAVSRTEPGSAGAGRAVAAISTGTVRIHPEHAYGSRKPLYWRLLTSRHRTPPRPVNVYVIEHARGLIVSDTGQDSASVTDGNYFPGGLTGYLYDRVARFDISGQDTLTAQLAALGYTPADVGMAIVSHLHQDHTGGLGRLKDAGLLLSDAEWAELSKAAPELRGFLPRHIQVPGFGMASHHDGAGERSLAGALYRVAGCHGGRLARAAPHPRPDGRLTSLFVRRGTKAPPLLAGRPHLRASILEHHQLPGIGNKRRLAETSRKVLDLNEQTPGPGHPASPRSDSRHAAARKLTLNFWPKG